MKSETRSKMVAGAADLIRRRGVNATSVREVVRHTETPRGSIGHHFPRGKQQLVEDAVTYAGQEVSGPLEKLVTEHGAVAGLRAFIELWRNVLESSKCEAGCPVLAVAVEQYLSDDGTPNLPVQHRLLELAREIFDHWQRILSVSLRKDGITPARARGLFGGGNGGTLPSGAQFATSQGHPAGVGAGVNQRYRSSAMMGMTLEQLNSFQHARLRRC